MKGLIQRVTKASVSVDGTTISSIDKGLCVLVGISRKDKPKDADWLARKILNIRLFDGEDDKRWDKSVMDKQYEVLCVSQFTLDMILKGNKPDFHCAMNPDESQAFYQSFVKHMREIYSEDKVKDGIFGADMQVLIQNDGPVTIPLESPENLPDPKLRKPQNNCKKTSKDAANQDKKMATESSSQANATPDTTAESQGATGDS